MPEARTNDFIQSLDRGLAVMRSFSKERTAQTLSEAAQHTGLTRATVRRVLLTLAELGYVHQDGRFFSLTPRVLDLGYSYLSSFKVVELAQQPMEKLVEAVKESSSMAVLDGEDIVYVARVPTKRIMTIALAIGSRLPAYPTSMGRVLLAGMPAVALDEYVGRARFEELTSRTLTDRQEFRATIEQVRTDGYALVDQELEEGVRSIAAPIRNERGDVIAAMNVSCHASRVTVERMRKEFRPHLLNAATEISMRVGLLPRS
ncbi:MAG TPA: IclR family transcriptional regulator C-terminal domain-containing protein [Acidimicrobiia bacterium]|nr:IclR family transcriptional regulator C-terminal domain-containing protein [Acidimicrobiia bacterium]